MFFGLADSAGIATLLAEHGFTLHDKRDCKTMYFKRQRVYDVICGVHMFLYSTTTVVLLLGISEGRGWAREAIPLIKRGIDECD